jgi:shikimate 5-dehydrogenase
VLSWGDLESGAEREIAALSGRKRPRVWVSTLTPDLPPLPDGFWARGGTGTVLLDMNYGVGRTARTEEAHRHGWRAADGLGPLCRQAALSLSLWLGEEVPTGLFYRALRRTERSLRPRR